MKGTLTVTGHSKDALSGLAKAELSLDDGQSWQPLALSDDKWEYTWDTRRLPNGSSAILVRVRDMAGSLESPVEVRVMLANQPPKVVLQERWMVWEKGALTVHDAGIPLGRALITIRDPEKRWPAVVLEYGPGKIPPVVYWDRHFGGGILAPAGEYEVEVQAWDIYGNEGRDTGKIIIPFVFLPVPTWTPIGAPISMADLLPTQKAQPTPQPT